MFLSKAHFPQIWTTSILACLIVLGTASPARSQTETKACRAPADIQQKLDTQPSAAAYEALGAYFGEQKEFACAISAFRSSLRLDPNSWETHYYLALVLLTSGNPQEAARELRISLQLHPQLLEAHLTLGAALSQLNQTDGAIEQFQIVLRENPASVTALDWLAKAYISQKRYPAAIFLLQNAPADEVLRMDLVLAYSQSGDTSRAVKILTQMKEDYPTSPVAHSGLGMAYTQLHRYQEAAAEFMQALKLNPQDDLALVSYLRVLIVLGQFQPAEPLAQNYLRDHPADFDANYLIGVIERELGNYVEAKERLAEATRINPAHYDARYNLGVALAKLGRPAEAREQLEKAVQLNPGSPEAHFQLATVLRALSLPDAAREQLALYQCESAEQAKKDVAVTEANRAKEFLQDGNAQKAVDIYREAVNEDPKNSQILFELAMALDREGDFTGEQEALERAIEMNPDFAAAHNQMGQLIFQTGRSAEAEQEFKTAISLNPHYAEAQSNLGVLYGQEGRDAEAEKCFRQAIDSDPEYAQAYVNLAVALADQSRFAEAETAAESAIRISPDNQEARELQVKLRAELDHRDAPQ